jgi:hypothetical protein
VNDTILNGLGLDYTLISSECDVIPNGYSLSIYSKLGLDSFPRVLLRVEFSRRCTDEAWEGNKVSWLGAGGWLKELCGETVCGFSTKDHSVRHIICHLSGLKVAQDNTQSILHILKGDEFL